MKTPITLEPSRAHTVKDSEISVVSREIDKYREVSWALRTLIVG